MQIIQAASILGGLGLFFGVVLALAARFFAVESDPLVDEVREALPGANCGACGYAGCTNFAEAVVQGDTSLSGCIPGGNDVAAAIGEILGKKVEETVPLVATVFCIGGTEEAHNNFIYDGIWDCNIAQTYGGGFKACPYGCLGLGSCVAACPFEAIAMGENGLPVIDPELCGGCGLCAEACPRGIIKILPKGKDGHLVLCNSQDRGRAVSRACKVGCIACKACIKACEQEAITMDNNLAVIDLEKCTDCGDCAQKCRPGTIYPRTAKTLTVPVAKETVSA